MPPWSSMTQRSSDDCPRSAHLRQPTLPSVKRDEARGPGALPLRSLYTTSMYAHPYGSSVRISLSASCHVPLMSLNSASLTKSAASTAFGSLASLGCTCHVTCLARFSMANMNAPIVGSLSRISWIARRPRVPVSSGRNSSRRTPPHILSPGLPISLMSTRGEETFSVVLPGERRRSTLSASSAMSVPLLRFVPGSWLDDRLLVSDHPRQEREANVIRVRRALHRLRPNRTHLPVLAELVLVHCHRLRDRVKVEPEHVPRDHPVRLQPRRDLAVLLGRHGLRCERDHARCSFIVNRRSCTNVR